ncbi:competence/damage-inducible protein A [Rhabdochromatium marinum]|uniref:competence/damage-inducible protein A n=1 Tax=Rhabdochromatium marinum TaxID=48729 RepID=UPI001905C3FE|nr:molybdopterin-binding protein [Rhabdochromatium marinum]MBK1649819.1 competence/damage-inducible protein A [Rhabdochromatium marinum]
MSDTDSQAAPLAFGLIVIGDEVLNGTRSDGHFPALRERLLARGHQLAWYWMLPDDPPTIVRHLRQSFAVAPAQPGTKPTPVFCCGGIGATPDDHTRACAATAAEVPLVPHPEARTIIEERFGAEAYPHRILMAELPEGSTLIPNPVTRVPGFQIHQHWFLPGFPSMAWPMVDWVLDTHYAPTTGAQTIPLTEQAVEVVGVAESRLIPLMHDLGAEFPALKLFSLPHMGEDPCIRLGFRGRGTLDAAMQALCERLTAEQIHYRAPRF